VQQGDKLVGSYDAEQVREGVAVALNGDGTVALVGGTTWADGIGAVWVFTQSGGNWTQQGNKLVGSDVVGSANQGGSVALSNNGTVALVGGEGDSDGIGAAWIFTQSRGNWTQQGNKLVGSDVVGAANFGWAVALSSDGTVAVIGGFSDNDGVGATWVFKQSGGQWTQQGIKLVGAGAVGDAGQGYPFR